jgi:hypothetical protein
VILEQKFKYLVDPKDLLQRYLAEVWKLRESQVRNMVYNTTTNEGFFRLQGQIKGLEDSIKILEKLVDKANQH